MYQCCQNLGCLCTNSNQKYGDQVTEEKEREALLHSKAKGKHTRPVPQGLCPCLVSRERLHGQEEVCDVDQGRNSHAFFCLPQSFKRVRLLTSLGCVHGLRWPSLLVLMRLLLVIKNPPASAGDIRCGFAPWVVKMPWRRAWQPAPVFSPGESHGQRSLAGHSPWGCKESDTTEQLTLPLH